MIIFFLLQRLNQVIQHRLVTSKLPPEMGQMIIGKNNSCDGRFVEMFVDIFSLSFCNWIVQYRESTPLRSCTEFFDREFFILNTLMTSEGGSIWVRDAGRRCCQSWRTGKRDVFSKCPYYLLHSNFEYFPANSQKASHLFPMILC